MPSFLNVVLCLPLQGMGFTPNSAQGPNGPNNQNVPQMHSMNQAIPNRPFQSGMYWNVILFRNCDLDFGVVHFGHNFSVFADFSHQNNVSSNSQPASNDNNPGDHNELPPLPPGPPPPLSGHSYATPAPPGTSVIRPPFYGQTNNSKY